MYSSTRLKSDSEQKISRNLNMIKLFYQNKDYSTAKSYINDLLVAKPDSSEAYKLLSQINEAIGEYDQAAKNYQKSLDLKHSNDFNSSFDNSYQFTPTKLSSPVPVNNKTTINQINSNESTPNQVNVEKVEKLLEKKFSVFEKSFENINQQLSLLNDQFGKSIDEFVTIKKKFADTQKKLTMVVSKQEELSNKISALPLPVIPPKNEDNFVKEQLKTLAASINNLSRNNDKVFDELFNLKENVQILLERNHASDYDEESYQDDGESYEQQYVHPQLNLADQPKLNELFKISKDVWRCEVCDTANSKTDPTCPCCENSNPNMVKPQVNGIESSSTSPFKFGVPSFVPNNSTPAFSFGGTNSSNNSMFKFPSNENNPTQNVEPSKTISSNNQISNPLFGNSPVLNLSKPSSTVSFGSVSTNQTFPTFGNSANVTAPSSSFLTSTINSIPVVTQSVPNSLSAFSFTNVLSSLNENQTSVNASTASTTSFSIAPFRFGLNTSSTLQNSSIFSLPTSTNTILPIQSKPTSNFSFSNVSFTPNLLEPISKTTEGENENNDSNHLENGLDHSQDGDYFKLPEVKMPEKYDQITGEEEEEVIFENKCKLYRHCENEYKERGVGIIKILKHKKTMKYRVLMRREHIFKVCLNAHLADIMKHSLKITDKYLQFSCIDFSEDQPTSRVLLLKMGQMEKLHEFKGLIESLLEKSNDSSPQLNKVKEVAKQEIDPTLEIVYVKEPKPEHVEKIKSLKLPVNFYDYEDKSPCKGCIGCNVDSLNWSELTTNDEEDKTDSKGTDLGLFQSISTDMNVSQCKVNSIDTVGRNFEHDHMKEQNFVSEKSKLLPQEFEVLTGEENEEILFNERAKLFHYINDEWKERGVGNMKILKRNDSDSFRLLMRRDRIFNVICNHTISKQLTFKPFPNSLTSFTWFAKDYSEETEGIDKMFTLRFKNEDLVKKFQATVNECIEKCS